MWSIKYVCERVNVCMCVGEQLFSSSRTVDLTESEAEYVVSCIKHCFPMHTVLQFNIKNTMEEEQLEKVCVCACVCSWRCMCAFGMQFEHLHQAPVSHETRPP